MAWDLRALSYLHVIVLGWHISRLIAACISEGGVWPVIKFPIQGHFHKIVAKGIKTHGKLSMSLAGHPNLGSVFSKFRGNAYCKIKRNNKNQMHFNLGR